MMLKERCCSLVQDVLGHSDSRMTMGLYAHVLKGQKKTAADAMEALMRSVSSQQFSRRLHTGYTHKPKCFQIIQEERLSKGRSCWFLGWWAVQELNL